MNKLENYLGQLEGEMKLLKRLYGLKILLQIKM